MILEEKKEYILDKLSYGKILKVKDLSKELNCTEASIRYIVNDLAKKKLLRRVHGGVVREEKTIVDVPERIVRTRNIEEKEYIANLAVDFIQDNSTIILDSGTTNLVFAEKFKGIKNLNIITNSIKIANLLIDYHNHNVIMLGGLIRPLTYTAVSYSAESGIKSLKANKLFLNIGAASLEKGLTDPNIQEAQAKKDIIEIADEIILLADSSKFDKVALSVVCPFNKVDKLITDKKVEKDFVRKAEKLGVKVYY